MEEGTLFRQLRKDRGLTIQQVADDLNSVSFVSKFEKGDSRISVHRLEQLLNNINVSVEEFFYLRAQAVGKPLLKSFTQVPSYLTSPFMEVMDRIFSVLNHSKPDYQKQIDHFQAIKAELVPKIRWQRFIILLLEVSIKNAEINLGMYKEQFEKDPEGELERHFERLRKKFRPVVSYLYSVENWGIFEVILFRMFQFGFPLETVRQLMPTALSRTKKEIGLPLMQSLRSDLLFACFSTFTNFRKLDWAKETLDLAQENLRNESDLLNSTKLLFFQGWYQIIAGNREKGIEKCQQAISIFRILDQPTTQKDLGYMLKLILRNADDPFQAMLFS